jgi:serine/threonine-protein kinase
MLGPYQVIGRIGVGGMGEVFRARDTRLDRLVAIKRLIGLHKGRFQREARAVAALNHPHVCTLHDVGSDFLVMELIEGRILTGPMPAEDLLPLAIQIASAVQAAHTRGILHRDLKPANVLINSSGAKVLDFGLAKWIGGQDDTAETQTREGSVVGTVSYMSPEQAQGKPLDARSDIFSFGALLYEALTGRRAFEGNTVIETFAAVVTREPAPIGEPASFARIITRCLRKSPDARYQTMDQVAAELQQLEEKFRAVPTRTGPVTPSIAVLPFANLSADPDQEYFSDGLADEITNLLARIPGINVAARTSAFAFKGKHEDIRQIANLLGVTHVLEGSVRCLGARVRATVHLIQASDGTNQWSGRYDRELADVFELQDEVAGAIAGALRVKLANAISLRRNRPNLAAYEAYLKARHHCAKMTPPSLARSREYFEQAIDLDPQFALAHAGLADMFLMMTSSAAIIPAHQAMPLVRAGAERAIELDPALPEAHALLGVVAGVYEFNWTEAERCFELAMSQDYVPPTVRSLYGFLYLLPLGRKEAVDEISAAVAEDPLNPVLRTSLATALGILGRTEEQSREIDRLFEFEGAAWHAHLLKAANRAQQGMIPEALAHAEQAFAVAPWNHLTVAILAALLDRAGAIARANSLCLSLEREADLFGVPRALAWHRLLCRNHAGAAEWVHKALAQRDPLILGTHAWALHRSEGWAAIARSAQLPNSTCS